MGRLTMLDVVVEEASVSRSHAVLFVDEHGRLSVEDRSKFGTKVNEIRIAVNVKTPLASGDVITVGVVKKLVVTRVDLALAFAPSDAVLAQRASDGGLSVVSDVSQCTHMVLSRSAIVPKMLSALVLQKHVVSPSWLEALLGRKLASDPFPNEALYCPGLEEGSALPNASRAALFRGCTFCFPSDKVWNQFGTLCKQAGAARLLSPKDEVGPSLSMQDKTLFVYPTNEDHDEGVIQRLAALQSRNLPFVTAEGIALAILKCEFQFPRLDLMAEELSAPAQEEVNNVYDDQELHHNRTKKAKIDKKPEAIVTKKDTVKTEPEGRKNSVKTEQPGRNFKTFKKQQVASSKGLISRDQMLVQQSQSQPPIEQVKKETKR